MSDWETVVSLLGKKPIFVGFGSKPSHAYVDFFDSETMTRWRLNITPLEEEGERDWSFGVERVADPVDWREDDLIPR